MSLKYIHTPRGIISLLILLSAVASAAIQAEPPQTFHVVYDAAYGRMKAEAERSLSVSEKNGETVYQMQAVSRVTLLGRSLVTINEQSHFGWQDNLPLPYSYSYRQSGLGKRHRSIEFSPALSSASFDNNGSSGELELETKVYDDLNSFLVIAEQLRSGQQDINFEVLDRDHIKTYHYQHTETVMLDTPVGSMEAMHLRRIRDGDSERSTDIWLAPAHDYLLVKLLQEEPNGRVIRLDLSSAQINGRPLQYSP